MTLLIFHPGLAFGLAIAGLFLVGLFVISGKLRKTITSILALAPLTPLFVLRLIGIGIVALGLSIVRLADTIADRCTTAQRHAAWLVETYNL